MIHRSWYMFYPAMSTSPATALSLRRSAVTRRLVHLLHPSHPLPSLSIPVLAAVLSACPGTVATIHLRVGWSLATTSSLYFEYLFHFCWCQWWTPRAARALSAELSSCRHEKSTWLNSRLHNVVVVVVLVWLKALISKCNLLIITQTENFATSGIKMESVRVGIVLLCDVLEITGACACSVAQSSIRPNAVEPLFYSVSHTLCVGTT